MELNENNVNVNQENLSYLLSFIVKSRQLGVK